MVDDVNLEEEFILFFLSNTSLLFGELDLCLLVIVVALIPVDAEVEVLTSPCRDRLRLRCDSIRTEAGVPVRANVRFHMASLSSSPTNMRWPRDDDREGDGDELSYRTGMVWTLRFVIFVCLSFVLCILLCSSPTSKLKCNQL